MSRFGRKFVAARILFVGVLGLAALFLVVGWRVSASAVEPALELSPFTFVSPGAVLRFERDQPWTCISRFVISSPDAEHGSIIFTNVWAPPYTGYELWIEPLGKPRIKIMHRNETGELIQVTGSTNVADGKIHIVAATYDGSSEATGVKIYIDGEKETTTTERDNLDGTIVTGASLFVIGNQLPDGGLFELSGSMSFFALSTVARDAAYIASHSNYKTLPKVDADTALYYDFKDGSGTIVTDRSSNGFHGILANYYGGPPPQWIKLTTH